MKIAIIGGAGKMGRWLARFFTNDDYTVAVFDRDADGLRWISGLPGITTTVSIDESIAGADYIVISVPIEEFEDAVMELSHVILPDQFVVDITSTK